MTVVVGSLPNWDRALGPALFSAALRTTSADFRVSEKLAIEFTDDGEHDYLWIEKTAANTQWVAQCLARHARVALRDVGFAGLKDRHAITRQWFSVRRPDRDGTDWQTFGAEGVEILEYRKHRRKLKRGAHKGNSFSIVLRGDDITPNHNAIADRLARIGIDGVPNYFGEQRFGRDGGNINLARDLFSGCRLPRAKRSIALSAARSYLFNEILATRIRRGNWNTILRGELANLDGSGSVFSVDDVSEELVARCQKKDIHPSGTLWGRCAPNSRLDAADIERAAVGAYAELAEGLIQAKVDAASRALRLTVRDLCWEFSDDALQLDFSLDRGGFATAVLREIARTWDGHLFGTESSDTKGRRPKKESVP